MTDFLGATTGGLWPAGHRAAATILLLVDAPPGDDPGIDYTVTGLERLLGTFADVDISVTLACSESALNSYPPAIRRAADLGHEIAAWHHLTDTLGADALAGALSRVAGGQVDGSLTFDEAATSGVARWLVTGASGDLPVFAPNNTDGTSILIPWSPYWSDRTWLHPERPLPPSSMLEAWSLSLAEVRTINGLMTIVLNPHIIGRPGCTGTLVRFLDEIVAAGDVWLTRIGAISEWWSQQSTSR